MLFFPQDCIPRVYISNRKGDHGDTMTTNLQNAANANHDSGAAMLAGSRNCTCASVCMGTEVWCMTLCTRYIQDDKDIT